jgi:hypothetical protein
MPKRGILREDELSRNGIGVGRSNSPIPILSSLTSHTCNIHTILRGLWRPLTIKQNRLTTLALKQTMTEGKIEIPPPIGLLDNDSYSAKANRVTSATSVTTTFEYTITHADGSQVIQIVQDTNGDREVVETKELPATAASRAAAKIDIPKPVGVSFFLVCSRRAPVASLAPLAGVITEVPAVVLSRVSRA